MPSPIEKLLDGNDEKLYTLAQELIAWPQSVLRKIELRKDQTREVANNLGLPEYAARRFADAKWWRLPRQKKFKCSQKLLGLTVSELHEARRGLILKLTPKALECNGGSWQLTKFGKALELLLIANAHRLDAKDTIAMAELVATLTAIHNRSASTCIHRLLAAGPTHLLGILITFALSLDLPIRSELRLEWFQAVLSSDLLMRAPLDRKSVDKKRTEVDDELELDLQSINKHTTQDAPHRSYCIITSWKVTCATRYAMAHFVSAIARQIGSSQQQRTTWIPDLTQHTQHFAAWYWLARSASALAGHRGWPKKTTGHYLPPGYLEPFSSLMIESISDFNGDLSRAVLVREHIVCTELSQDNIFTALAEKQAAGSLFGTSTTAVLSNVSLRSELAQRCGGLTAAIVGPDDLDDTNFEAFWAPTPSFPLLHESWARAKPWQRAFLAFGELPALAWNAACNFDTTSQHHRGLRDTFCDHPEQFCDLGASGPGRDLLLALIADQPQEAAGVFGYMTKIGLETRQPSAACCIATLIVVSIDGLVLQSNNSRFTSRAHLPGALAAYLETGDRDAVDDATLAHVSKWAPHHAAALCTCMLSCATTGGARNAAVRMEPKLKQILTRLGPDGIRALFEAEFRTQGASRCAIFESLKLARPIETALECQLEEFAAIRKQVSSDLGQARMALGYTLACGSKEEALTGLLAISAAVCRFMKSAPLDKSETWSSSADTDSKDETTTSDSFILTESAKTSWRAAGELLIAAASLLPYADAPAVAFALPTLGRALNGFVKAVTIVRARIDAAIEEATSEDEEELQQIAYNAEVGLVGVCARGWKTLDAQVDAFCPRKHSLVSVLPSFPAFVLSCRLLARMSGSRIKLDGNEDTQEIIDAAPKKDAVYQTRKAAVSVVIESLLGTEAATCSWLTDLVGSAKDLAYGCCTKTHTAGESRCGFPASAPSDIRTNVISKLARASLGFVGSAWYTSNQCSSVSISPCGSLATTLEGTNDVFRQDIFDLQKARAALSSSSFVLRKPLHELHLACIRDAETAIPIKRALPCIAAFRLLLANPTPAYGRRPWLLQEDEAWASMSHDDKLELAKLEGKKLGQATADLLVTSTTALPERHSAYSSATIESAVLGVTMFPDVVRSTSNYFCVDHEEDSIFRMAFAENVLPSVARVFREHMQSNRKDPEAYGNQDTVHIRQHAVDGCLKALCELRWRDFWAHWLVGPCEAARQVAREALLSHQLTPEQRELIGVWLGRLIVDTCRRPKDRDPGATRSDENYSVSDAGAARAVERLLEAGGIISTKDESPLHLACRAGRTRLALSLLQSGALRVDKSDWPTLIKTAFAAKAFDLAELLYAASNPTVLIEHNATEIWPGADAEELLADSSVATNDISDEEDDNSDDFDANDRAARWEWLPDTEAAMECLLRAGSDTHLAGESILHHCIRYCLLDAANVLLTRGNADPNQPDAAGVYPIHLACGLDVLVKPASLEYAKPSVEIPTFLAPKSYQIKAKSMTVPYRNATVTTRYSTPSIAAVRLLLRHGARSDVQAPCGLGTPAAVALQSVAYIKAETLQSKYPDIIFSQELVRQATESWSKSLKLDVSQASLLDIVKIARHPGFTLQEATQCFKVSPNSPSDHLSNVYAKATSIASMPPNQYVRAALAEAEALQCVQVFLDVGAKLSVPEAEGWALPLHCAAASGQNAAVDLLLAAGIQGNSRAALGSFWACSRIAGWEVAADCAARVLHYRTTAEERLQILSPTTNETPLLLAAMDGSLSVVAMMLDVLRLSLKKGQIISANSTTVQLIQDAILTALEGACEKNHQLAGCTALRLLLNIRGIFSSAEDASLLLQRRNAVGNASLYEMCIQAPEAPNLFNMLLSILPLDQFNDCKLLAIACQENAPGCAGVLLNRMNLISSKDPVLKGPYFEDENDIIQALAYVGNSNNSSGRILFSERDQSDFTEAEISDWTKFARVCGNARINKVSSLYGTFYRKACNVGWQSTSDHGKAWEIHFTLSSLGRVVFHQIELRFGRRIASRIVSRSMMDLPRQLEAAVVGAGEYGRSDFVAAEAVSAMLGSKLASNYMSWKPPILSTLHSSAHRGRDWQWSPLKSKAQKNDAVRTKYDCMLKLFGEHIELHSLVHARFCEPKELPLITLLVLHAAAGGSTARLAVLLERCSRDSIAKVLNLSRVSAEAVAHRADLIWDKGLCTESALHLACQRGSVEDVLTICRACVEAGIGTEAVMATDRLGRTPLSTLIEYSTLDDIRAAQCVAVLLGLGLDPNSRFVRIWSADHAMSDEKTRQDNYDYKFVTDSNQLAPCARAYGGKLEGAPVLYEAIRRGSIATARELVLAGASEFAVLNEGSNHPDDKATLQQLTNNDVELAKFWRACTTVLRIDTPLEVSSADATTNQIVSNNILASSTDTTAALNDPILRRIFDSNAKNEAPVLAFYGRELNARLLDISDSKQRQSTVLSNRVDFVADRTFKQLAKAEDSKDDISVKALLDWFSSDASSLRELLCDAPHNLEHLFGALPSFRGTLLSIALVHRAFHDALGKSIESMSRISLKDFKVLISRLRCEGGKRILSSEYSVNLSVEISNRFGQAVYKEGLLSGALNSTFQDGRAWTANDELYIRRGFEGKICLRAHLQKKDARLDHHTTQRSWVLITFGQLSARAIALSATQSAVAGESIPALEASLFDLRGRSIMGSGESVLFEAQLQSSQYEKKQVIVKTEKATKSVLDARLYRAGDYIARAFLIMNPALNLKSATFQNTDLDIIAESNSIHIQVKPGIPASLVLTVDSSSSVRAGFRAPFPQVAIFDQYQNKISILQGTSLEFKLLCADSKRILNTLREDAAVHTTDRICGSTSPIIKEVGTYHWEVSLVTVDSTRRLTAFSEKFTVASSEAVKYSIQAPDIIEAGTILKVEVAPIDEHSNVVSSHETNFTLCIISTNEVANTLLNVSPYVISCQGPAEDGHFRLEKLKNDKIEKSRRFPVGTVIWSFAVNQVRGRVEVNADPIQTAGDFTLQLKSTIDGDEIVLSHNFRVEATEPALVHVHCAGDNPLGSLPIRVYISDSYGNPTQMKSSSATIALELYSLSEQLPLKEGELSAHRCLFAKGPKSKNSTHPYPICANSINGLADFSDFDLRLPAPGNYAIVAHTCVWTKFDTTQKSSLHLTGASRMLQAVAGAPSSIEFISQADGLHWPGEHFIAGIPWNKTPVLAVTDTAGYPPHSNELQPPFVLLSVHHALSGTKIEVDNDINLQVEALVAQHSLARCRAHASCSPIHGRTFALVTRSDGQVTFDNSALMVMVPGRYVLTARLFGVSSSLSALYSELARCESRAFNIQPQLKWCHSIITASANSADDSTEVQKELSHIQTENRALLDRAAVASALERKYIRSYLSEAKTIRVAANAVRSEKGGFDNSRIRDVPMSVEECTTTQLKNRLDVLARYASILSHDKGCVCSEKGRRELNVPAATTGIAFHGIQVSKTIIRRNSVGCQETKSHPDQTINFAAVDMLMQEERSHRRQILSAHHQVWEAIAEQKLLLEMEEESEALAVALNENEPLLSELFDACVSQMSETTKRIASVLDIHRASAVHIEGVVGEAQVPDASPPEDIFEAEARQYSAHIFNASLHGIVATLIKDRHEKAIILHRDNTNQAVIVKVANTSLLSAFIVALKLSDGLELLEIWNGFDQNMAGRMEYGCIRATVSHLNQIFCITFVLQYIDELLTDMREYDSLAQALVRLSQDPSPASFCAAFAPRGNATSLLTS